MIAIKKNGKAIGVAKVRKVHLTAFLTVVVLTVHCAGVLAKGGASLATSKQKVTKQEEGNALIRACEGGNYDLVKSLIQTGSNVNYVDESGTTPLHAASKNGNIWVVQALLKRGAKTDFQNNSGMLPIHIAATYGRTKVGEMLIDMGSPIEAKDNEGRTPLQIAKRRKDNNFIRMLVLKGGKKQQSSTPRQQAKAKVAKHRRSGKQVHSGPTQRISITQSQSGPTK